MGLCQNIFVGIFVGPFMVCLLISVALIDLILYLFEGIPACCCKYQVH